MAAQQIPSIGRIVHYVLPEGHRKGEHRPAIIVKVWDEHPTLESVIQLQVFLDGTNDVSAGTSYLRWATSVKHAEAHLHELGTYHYEEEITLPASD
jgi:hypothetical protein